MSNMDKFLGLVLQYGHDVNVKKYEITFKDAGEKGNQYNFTCNTIKDRVYEFAKETNFEIINIIEK